MIILNSVILEPCKQEYADGTLVLTAEIDYFFDGSEALDMDINAYIINPVDGAELLVGHSNIVNPPPVTKDRTKITVTITADQNIDLLRNIINEYGNRTYTLVIKPTLPNSTWDGSKTISTAEVQLINVDTSVSVIDVTSSANNSEVTIKVDAKYWNNECMSLNATLSTDQNIHKLSMSYDSNSQLWNGVATIIIPTGHCNQDITITLTGEYSAGCNPLPCTPWQYFENIKQTIKGPCMNTNFPAGLHTFVDTAYDDFTCSTILTSTSQHLVSSFMSHRNSDYPVQPRAAMKINQSTFLGRRPFIKRTPHLTDQNDRQYVIAWECAESSVHTIKVSKGFIPMGAEGVLNNGDKTSDNVRIVITENQTCYLFNASALNGETLSSDAVLLAVE